MLGNRAKRIGEQIDQLKLDRDKWKALAEAGEKVILARQEDMLDAKKWKEWKAACEAYDKLKAELNK